MKKLLISTLIALASTQAGATVFRTVDPFNSTYTNGSWSFGTIFTVGASDVTVTSLGAFDAGHDGFTSNSIQVGVFNNGNTLLASAVVQSSDNLLGDYRYASIANLVLQSGQQYRLVAVSDQDLYSFFGTTFSSDFTLNGYGYCSSNTLQACNSYQEFDYGMGNFQYTLGTASNTVPEPTSLALFGLGLAGAAIARRRKQK